MYACIRIVRVYMHVCMYVRVCAFQRVRVDAHACLYAVSYAYVYISYNAEGRPCHTGRGSQHPFAS